MTGGELPVGFEDLKEVARLWGLPTAAQRNAHRCSRSESDIASFYERVLPRMEAILEHLNQFPVDDLAHAERNLFNLALAFADAAHSVELRWKRHFGPQRLIETHSL